MDNLVSQAKAMNYLDGSIAARKKALDTILGHDLI